MATVAYEPAGVGVRNMVSRRFGLPRAFRIDLIRVVRPPAAASGSRRELLVEFGGPDDFTAPSTDYSNGWLLVLGKLLRGTKFEL